MPPSFGAPNLNEVLKRDIRPQNPDIDSPDHQLVRPGPIIGCIIGSLLVLFLVARLFWWITKSIKPWIRRRSRVPARLPLSQRILHMLHRVFPGFISSRLPIPAPQPEFTLDNMNSDYPARSIDTLPPYTGFVAPDTSSPADSRRFLFLVPMLPIIYTITRRSGSPGLRPQGSATVVGSAVTIVVQPSEPPPPDYTTLTPPYTASDGNSPASDGNSPTSPGVTPTTFSGHGEPVTHVGNQAPPR